jgi:hypothetical protein
MYLPPLAITFGHGMVRVYSEGLLMISHVTSKSGDAKSFSHHTRTIKVERWGHPIPRKRATALTSRKLLAVRDNGRWPNQEELIEVCTGCHKLVG